MTRQYFTEGAIDLADAGNWDGAGPANDAELVVPEGNATVTGVDLSAYKLLLLEFGAGFAGRVMTSAGGAMQTALDPTSGTGELRYLASGGELRYNANGPSTTLCELLKIRSGGVFRAMGGQISEAQVDACPLALFDESTQVDTLRVGGGNVELHPNANVCTGYIDGGLVTVKRAGTYHVRAGTAILDVESAGTLNVYLYGSAKVLHRRGSIATAELLGGEWDATGLQRDATIGTTALTINYSRCRLKSDERLTLSNVTQVGIGVREGMQPA